MSRIRFEPWSLADLVQRDLDRVGARRAGRAEAETPVINWTPPVDIVEEHARFVLRADLPGVDPSDIDLSMDEGFLSISGERKAGDRSDVDGIERYERKTGRFLRRFSLPETADADAITAKYDKGVLEITVPKLADVQPRRITVDAA